MFSVYICDRFSLRSLTLFVIVLSVTQCLIFVTIIFFIFIVLPLVCQYSASCLIVVSFSSFVSYSWCYWVFFIVCNYASIVAVCWSGPWACLWYIDSFSVSVSFMFSFSSRFCFSSCCSLSSRFSFTFPFCFIFSSPFSSLLSTTYVICSFPFTFPFSFPFSVAFSFPCCYFFNANVVFWTLCCPVWLLS